MEAYVIKNANGEYCRFSCYDDWFSFNAGLNFAQLYETLDDVHEVINSAKIEDSTAHIVKVIITEVEM